MIAPSVNVFITFKPQEIINLMESKSLQKYSENEDNKDYLLFSNSPNSTLLSLEHSYGVQNKPELTIRFLDPKDEFIKLLSPIDNFYLDVVNPYGFPSEDGLIRSSEMFGNESAEESAEFFRASKNSSNLNDEFFTKEKAQEDYLLSQIELKSELTKRPIFIMYGVGDDVIRDWCPPLVFYKPYDVTYKMDSMRAKEITLTYDGKGVVPNLGSLNIDFLKNHTNGVIINGNSERLFNGVVEQEIKNKYPKHTFKILGDSRNDVLNPSIHYTVRTAMTNLIKSATGSENVLVLLPDLDVYLKPFKSKIEAEAKYCNKSQKYVNVQLFCSLGFTITENKDHEYESESAILEQMYAEQGLSPRDYELDVTTGYYDEEHYLIEELQKRIIKASLSTNAFDESFLTKIRRVIERIKDLTTQYPAKEGIGSEFFSARFFVESNFLVLKNLYDQGLISSSTKPAIIFAPKDLYTNIICGNLLETNSTELDSDTKKRSYLQEYLSHFDIEDGINFDYVSKVYESLNPPIPTIGPFVGLANQETLNSLALKEDTNINKNLLETIKKDQKSTSARIPIFSFGTKNSNILSVDISVNPAITNLAGTFRFVNRESHIKTTLASFPKNKRLFYREVFDVLEEESYAYAESVNDVPEKFIELIKVLYSNNPNISLKGEDFSNSLNDLGYTEKELNDLNLKAKENKDEFYRVLWNSFNKTFRNENKQVMTIPFNLNKHSSKIIKSTGAQHDLSKQAMSDCSIKTLPYFNLGSESRCLTKKCLIFGKEANVYVGETSNTFSWYSGIYTIYGFKNRISKSDVSSEFFVAREPSGGGLIEF